MLKPLPVGLRSVATQAYCEPAEMYDAYRRTVQIQDFRSLVPTAECLHQVGYMQVGNTLMAACSGTSGAFLIEDCPDLHLLPCFHGSLSVTMPEGVAHCQVGGAMLLPPGDRQSLGEYSLASINLRPAAAAATAAAMAGTEEASPKMLQAIQQLQPQSLGHGPDADAIHGLMRFIDTCHTEDRHLAARLGLDDVIHRTVACLIDPTILDAKPHEQSRHRHRIRDSRFDELIDYIRANLDQPLRLSELEARSQLSARALQYLFKDKLGTTPTRWIREQRLTKAMERLNEMPHQRLSVRAVALSCGYRHAGLFSADFKRRFGMTPSEVLRPPLA